MLKWQVSPSSVSSRSYTTDASTSCASDSDATITLERSRRRQIHRKRNKISNRFSFDPEILNNFKKEKNRFSFTSSELTNITDLGNFSDLEKISDNELLLNDVFTREGSITPTNFNDIRLDSAASSIISAMEEGKDIYTILNGSFQEVQNWISFLLKVPVPKEELFDWLKDGTVLRKFSTKLSQYQYKRLKKFTKTLSRKSSDNILHFLKVCKKYNLSDAQLFHPSDWEYVIARKHKNARVQHLGWVVRARKIVSTFALLAITLKSNPKYECCVGKCTIKYLKEMANDLRSVQQCTTTDSMQSSPSSTNILMPQPSSSCLYDSDSSFRNRQKKVTFQENVQQHLCLVENAAKPYFTPLPKDAPPPKYEEFIAMKKTTDHPTHSSAQQSARQKDVSGTALSFNSLKADTLQRKSRSRDGNNNDTSDRSYTLPRINAQPYQEVQEVGPLHERPDTFGSQNELSLYNPVSYITGTPTKKSSFIKKSPQTKIKSPLVQKAASFINKAASPSIKKRGSHSDITDFNKSQPDSDISKPVSQQIVYSAPEGHQRISLASRNQSQESRMNTLTKAEINELNDLLSMFDEKEKFDPSIAVDDGDDENSLDVPDKSVVNGNKDGYSTIARTRNTNTLPIGTKILNEEPRRSNHHTSNIDTKVDSLHIGRRILDAEPRRSANQTPTTERKMDNLKIDRKMLDTEPRLSPNQTPKFVRKTLVEEPRRSLNRTPTFERKQLIEEPSRSTNHTSTPDLSTNHTSTPDLSTRTNILLDEEAHGSANRAHSYTRLNDLKPHKRTESTNNEKQQKLATKTNRDRQLDYLQDVVSELLAVGNVDILKSKTNNTPTVVSDKEPLNGKNDTPTNITRSIGSIENFFDDIENQQAGYQRVLNESSTNASSEEEDHNEVFSTEGNDSGIDETMPGIIKDSSGQKRKSGRHRKHQDEEENRKHKNEDKNIEQLKRSESESKRSRKHKSKEEVVKRTNSLPRSSKSSNSNTKGDVTIRIDGFDYNSENIGRHGRTKERRSEPPPYTSRPPVDPNARQSSKARRSEPIINNKVRHENDIDGGAIGNHKRSMTDSHVYKQPQRHHSHGGKDRSKSPEKKSGSRSLSNDYLKDKKSHHKDHRDGNSKHNGRHSSHHKEHQNDRNPHNRKENNGESIRRNNSVHIPSKSNEYMRDTPDGKHRVYVRYAKDEDPGPLPKKETIKHYDSNIREMAGRGKASETKLIDQLGVTPDIIQLLKEEEKFWHRQQELKEWRKSRDREISTRKEPPPQQYNNSHRTTTATNEANNYDAEILREAEENRMALKAQKLMKVRAEQEHILKTSRENLLDDIDNRPKSSHPDHSSSGPYPSPTEVRFSQQRNHTYDNYKNHNVNKENRLSASFLSKPLPSNPRPVVDKSTKSNYARTYSNSSNERFKQRTNSNDIAYDSAEKPKYVYSKITSSNGACFSDDDEVFNDSKRETNDVDHRGYFSDDGFRDNTVSKTYLARPMYRQQKHQLRCTACVKLITEQRLVYVDGHNFYWHSACFKCVVCKALLNDSSPIRVRIVNYNLHCRFCYSARNGEQLSEV